MGSSGNRPSGPCTVSGSGPKMDGDRTTAGKRKRPTRPRFIVQGGPANSDGKPLEPRLRALMRNPKILVLDRADTRAEQVRGVTDDIRPRPDVTACTRVGSVG